jgi:hypothetical protein
MKRGMGKGERYVGGREKEGKEDIYGEKRYVDDMRRVEGRA